MARRKAPTSQDVARLAGVSQSTVSYVLTGSRPISEATRERVEEAIEKLGYHPNLGARTLRSRRSGIIGLLVPEAHRDSGELSTFIVAISREARASGYDILLVTAQEGAAGVDRVVSTGVCEALILMELDRRDDRVAAAVSSGLPFVLLGKPEEYPAGTVVDLDFERVGRMAVRRAAAEDCDRLMLFGGLSRRRHRNDVSRLLRGAEEESEALGIGLLHDGGPLYAVPQQARERAAEGGRLAVFGVSGATEVLFAAAASGVLADPSCLIIAFSDEDLSVASPLLAATPRLRPRRERVSALAVAELVRLLGTPGAQPRVRLVEPEWAPAAAL